MCKVLRGCAIFLFIAMLSTSALAIKKNDFKVIRVIDGDTFIINDDSKHVRMANIDAPERKQSYGFESFSVLKNKIEGKTVTLDVKSKDKYGRLISNVYINGEDVNKYLVAVGAAWVYRYYCSDKSYYSLEYKSKISRLGLWRDDKPLPPWEYRAFNK